MAAITEERIAASTDDACSYGSNYPGGNEFGATYTSVYVGSSSGGTDYQIGLRFTSVPIPQGATINSASISLEAYNDSAGTGTILSIAAVDADDAATWGTDNKVHNATKTTARQTWNCSTAWTQGTWYTSDDISDVIQEVVDRPGWSSGNDLAIIVYPTTDQSESDLYRRVYQYDWNSDHAPKFNCTYTESAGGISIPVVMR